MIADKFGIDLVMYGGNQAEYGNRAKENSSPKMEQKFFTTDLNKEIKLGGKSIAEHLNNTKFTVRDFEPYLPLELGKSKVAQVHYLGYYLKWDPQECFYYAVENTGFKPNVIRTEGTYSKYSSIDDKIDPFHYYTTYIKFGLGRASYDAAQEVRNKKITRDEAIGLVKQFDSEFPNIYFKEFLDYINVTQSEFEIKINENRSPHLWSKSDSGEWKIKHAVWMGK
jgi:hypothetical protein